MLVLVRFFVRLAVWDRFFRSLRPLLDHFGTLLGSFSGFLGPIFGSRVPFGNLFLVDVRFSLFDFHFGVFAFRFVDAGLVPGPADCALRD